MHSRTALYEQSYFRRMILLAFVAALLGRLGVAWWLPAEVVWSDGIRYERVAQSLLAGEGFGDLVMNRMSVPTLPLVIAGVYKIFGQSYTALRIIFAIVGASICILGALLANRLFGYRIAIVSCWILAGYPLFVYLSGLFEYPQGLFILFTSLFFLSFYRFRDTAKLWPLFWSGLWLGLGILTVPTALIFAFALYLLLLTRDWRTSLQRIGVLTLALAVTVGAWTTRNYVAYDRFILVNKAGGFNFWSSNNETYYQYGKRGIVPPCAPGYEQTQFCHDWLALGEETRSKGFGAPDKTVERVDEEERIAWAYARAFVEKHPDLLARLTLERFIRFWNPIPDAVLEGESRGGTWRDMIAIISYTPVLLFAIAGLVISARKYWRRLLPVYIFAVTFVAPYAMFLPVTRYRLPIDFIFIIFAALAIVKAWDWLSKPAAQRIQESVVTG